MKGSRSIRPCRVPTFIAMLCGAIFTILLLPAFGQQEVDPTWYDPWAAPNTVVVHSSQPQVAINRPQPKIRSVSSTRVAGKVRVKRSTTRRPS
jgi:hypothetical protein